MRGPSHLAIAIAFAHALGCGARTSLSEGSVDGGSVDAGVEADTGALDCGTGPGMTLLAPGETGIGAIAVDSTSLYWNTTACSYGKTVSIAMKVPLCGGTPVTLGSAPSSVDCYGTVPFATQTMAVGATSVYWSNPYGNLSTGFGNLMKVPLHGGTPSTLATGLFFPWSVALDATTLYWSETSGDNLPPPENIGSAGGVAKVPLTGGPPTILAPGNGGALAVDATSIYWFASGGLMKMPLTGGAPTTLAALGSKETSGPLALDATGAYWIQTETVSNNVAGDLIVGDVVMVPLGGGAPTRLAAGQRNPAAIAVDATHVYWTNQGWQNGAPDGSVMKIPLGGGMAITLAAGLSNSPGALAVDAESVYWVSEPNGTPGGIIKLTPK